MSANRLLRVLLAATVLVMACGTSRPAEAGPEERRFEGQEVVRAGLAVGSFRGLPFRSGIVVLRANGDGSGQIAYGDAKLPGARVQLAWQERMPSGVSKAIWEPGTHNPLEWWHPTHRVRVRSSDVDSRNGPDEDDLLQLSKQIADKLASRALRWEHPYDDLRLEHAVAGYRLVQSDLSRVPSSDPSRKTELAYKRPLSDQLSSAERLARARGFELRFRWLPRRTRRAQSDETWGPIERDLESLGTDFMQSRTHYVRVAIRGNHWANGKYVTRFHDVAHREEARQVAATVLRQFERVAESRDAPLVGGPLVEDRPEQNAKTDTPSGQITRISGGVRVMRDGRRVNLRTGGKVALGDTILTNSSGTVEIRFDDPKAGPSRSGTLIVGPGSKVTIDVGPYRPRSKARPTRIRVDEGAARFARPHHHGNPRFELGTPGDVAIFGLHGTDAVLYHLSDRYVLVLADGMGDLAVNGRHLRVLVPGRAYQVGRDGRDLGGTEVTSTWYDSVIRDMSLGSATAAPAEEDLEALLAEDFQPEDAQPKAPRRDGIVGTWNALPPAPEVRLEIAADGRFHYGPPEQEDRSVRGTWTRTADGVRFELLEAGGRPLDPAAHATGEETGFDEIEISFPDGKVVRFVRHTSLVDLPDVDEPFHIVPSKTPLFVGAWRSFEPVDTLRVDIEKDGSLTYVDGRAPDRVATGTWTRRGELRFVIESVGEQVFDPPVRVTVEVVDGRLHVTFPDGKAARFLRAKPGRR